MLEATDGRSMRRSRNREAVVLAALELIRDHGRVPTMDEVAERSGVSARSVFRYFDDSDDLVGAVVEEHRRRLMPLWEEGERIDRSLPFAERLDAFVTARVALLEAMGPVAWVARVRAAEQPVIAAELARVRAALRGQLAALFAPELPSSDDGDAVLAAADVLASWEAHDLLGHDHRLDRTAARAAIATGLGRLLAPPVATTTPNTRRRSR